MIALSTYTFSAHWHVFVYPSFIALNSSARALHFHPFDYFLCKLHLHNGSNISCGKVLASPSRVHTVTSENKHSDSSRHDKTEMLVEVTLNICFL